MNNLKGLGEKKKAEIMAMSIVEVYQAGYEAGKSSTSPSVEVVQETIEHNGLLLRKVVREAQEGDYIRPTDSNNSNSLVDGEIYGPVRIDGAGNPRVTNQEYRVYTNAHNRTTSTVEVFEVVEHMGKIPLQDVPIIKSPNQQRSELIQRAREFVEGQKCAWGRYRNRKLAEPRNYWGLIADFIVNAEKRTVVVLLKGYESFEIAAKGIAKCMPDEVFNADIGKAIALARALEIDIPEEFLQAVQPTEKVVGMIIEEGGVTKSLVSSDKDVRIMGEGYGVRSCHIESGAGERGVVVDDTHAQYGEASS